MRVRSLRVAGLAAGLLAGGTVGIIVGASTTPQIKACVQPGGLMRYTTSTCKSGEKLLTWNVQGPRGPQGATGPQGPQGPQGAPGSGGGSAGTSFYFVDGGPGGFNDTATVAKMKLPAGTFALDWYVNSFDVACGIFKLDSITDPNGTFVYGVVTFTKPTPLVLKCYNNGGTTNYTAAFMQAQPVTVSPGLPWN